MTTKQLMETRAMTTLNNMRYYSRQGHVGGQPYSLTSWACSVSRSAELVSPFSGEFPSAVDYSRLLSVLAHIQPCSCVLRSLCMWWFWSYILFILCACAWTREVRAQLAGVGSLLLPHGSQELNSRPKTWRQAPLPAVLSHWSGLQMVMILEVKILPHPSRGITPRGFPVFRGWFFGAPGHIVITSCGQGEKDTLTPVM